MNDERTQPTDQPSVQAATCDCLALEKECLEYKTGWQRAVADYQNLQKEVARQRGEWAAMGETQIISEMLPVYDNFKKAFAAAHTEDNWAKGIGFIMKQMSDVLKNHGIEEIPTVGESFNAARHESVGEEISEQPEHSILREVDGGYTMRGKVLKVAKVILAAKKD